MGQLKFSSGSFSSGERSGTGGRCPPDPLGFSAFGLAPAGACRAGQTQPDLPYARLQSALRLHPCRALSSAEAPVK